MTFVCVIFFNSFCVLVCIQRMVSWNICFLRKLQPDRVLIVQNEMPMESKERNLCPVKISRHAPQLFHTDCTYLGRFFTLQCILKFCPQFLKFIHRWEKKWQEKKAFGMFCKTPGTEHALSYLSGT